MAIPSIPVKLIRFHWRLSELPTDAAQISKPFVMRPAGEPELEEALRVIRSSYELDPEWSGCAKHIGEFVLPQVEHAFANEANCLFVQHGNRVIAASAYLPEPGEHGVHLVSGPCVLIEYRNRGIGAALLAGTLEALRSRGLAEAVGQTRPNSPSAKYLFRKFGGQPAAAPPVQLASAETAVAA